MAVDIFLKLGDIKGESTDSKHPGEIVIESFSFGQAADVNDTGLRTGKLSLQDFHFVMPQSRATPQLMTKAAKGDKVVTGDQIYAQLTVRKAGATQVEYLKIKFYDVLITSFQNAIAASDPGVPVDQFTLWFGKIEYSYSMQKPDGSLDAPTLFRWDRIKGESF
jgi:type VI secretion system secreted protein Hcp